MNAKIQPREAAVGSREGSSEREQEQKYHEEEAEAATALDSANKATRTQLFSCPFPEGKVASGILHCFIRFLSHALPPASAAMLRSSTRWAAPRSPLACGRESWAGRWTECVTTGAATASEITKGRDENEQRRERRNHLPRCDRRSCSPRLAAAAAEMRTSTTRCRCTRSTGWRDFEHALFPQRRRPRTPQRPLATVAVGTLPWGQLLTQSVNHSPAPEHSVVLFGM